MLKFSKYIIKTNIYSRTFQVSAGDVGAERNVQAGANSDPRGEMRENVYWFLRIFILLNCNYFLYVYNKLILL